ncbi:hypothetical protein GQ600_11696 [Phytophthora cactorum]|nr:hypothetical protein GQ600_11696 [Phytophthora cactorum]
MSMCVKSLVAYDRRVQNEYQYRFSRIGQFVNSNYDETFFASLRTMLLSKSKTVFNAMLLPCQHATAFRKRESVAGPLIPWNCIDERILPGFDHDFTYRLYFVTRSRETWVRKDQLSLRMHVERYREAVRATHLITSELVDIGDES